MRKFAPSRLLSIVAWSVCAPIAMHATAASAQRVIFPSPVTDGNAPVFTAQTTTPFSTNPSTQYGSPALPYNASPASAPPTYAPPAGSAFDPYGGQPSSLAPPVYDAGAPVAPNNGFIPTAFRLLQEARFQSTYIARTGNTSTPQSFGMNDEEMYLSFGFPVPKSDAPLLITPGFNFHFLDGPNSMTVPNGDLPPVVYDAYVATSWRPQVTQRFSADLAFSIGIYGDYSFVNSRTIRYLGRAIGIYAPSPTWSIAGGAIYLDRLSVKLLPAAGLIWTPHPDTRYEILFPNPKLSQRITTYGNIDIWGYLRGEYGGGQWTVTHVSGQQDTVNYNDFRIILGVDWFNLQRMRGNFEVGYVFNRQILYLASAPTINPADSVMLRAGISY